MDVQHIQPGDSVMSAGIKHLKTRVVNGIIGAVSLTLFIGLLVYMIQH